MGGKRKLRSSASSSQHHGVKFMAEAESSKLHCYNPDDRISQLPDDILRLVFSFLTIKEAAITSFLSRRWRYLWASTSFLRIDFGTSILPNKQLGSGEDDDYKKLGSKYVKLVNVVLRPYRGQHVGEFSLRAPLGQKHTRFLDWCLKLALSRKVRKLEFDFTQLRRARRDLYLRKLYDLRVRALEDTRNSALPEAKRARIDLLQGLPRVSWSCPGFKSLTSLSFKFLQMGGDVLEGFLSNCPLLESLVLYWIRGLVRVKIVGPSLRLKYLEMGVCVNLEEIDIYDAPLVSLKRYGSDALAFRIGKVPSLIELSVPAHFKPRREVDMFSSCLSHLKSLRLLPFEGLPLGNELISAISKLTELRELEIMLETGSGDLLLLVPVIEASPHLHKLVIRIVQHCRVQVGSIYTYSRQAATGVASLGHLKVFVYAGYGCWKDEDDLIWHVLDNAVGLETIVIDPRCQTGYKYDPTACSKTAEDLACVRRHAKHWLEPIISPRTKLVIE